MAIASIGGLEQLTQLFQSQKNSETESPEGFEKIFQEMIDAVNNTDRQVKTDEMMIATGQSDDLHTLMIDTAKADIALQTLVQVRNKALDAYKEIMQMSV